MAPPSGLQSAARHHWRANVTGNFTFQFQIEAHAGLTCRAYIEISLTSSKIGPVRAIVAEDSEGRVIAGASENFASAQIHAARLLDTRGANDIVFVENTTLEIGEWASPVRLTVAALDFRPPEQNQIGVRNSFALQLQCQDVVTVTEVRTGGRLQLFNFQSMQGGAGASALFVFLNAANVAELDIQECCGFLAVVGQQTLAHVTAALPGGQREWVIVPNPNSTVHTLNAGAGHYQVTVSAIGASDLWGIIAETTAVSVWPY